MINHTHTYLCRTSVFIVIIRGVVHTVFTREVALCRVVSRPRHASGQEHEVVMPEQPRQLEGHGVFEDCISS